MRQMRVVTWGVVVAAALALAACDDKGGAKSEPSATPSGKSAKTEHSAKGETSGKAATSGTTSAAASSSGESPAAAAAAEANREKAAETLRQHHRHHHGGFAMFVHMAIDSLGLEGADKAKVEAIQKKIHDAAAPARAAGHDVLQALADGAAAGKIDDAKIQPLVKKQQDAAAKVHDAVIAAMNELHDALKPEQRVALVDKIKAHAAVWKSQNHDEADSKEKGSRLAHLKETLKLTDDQVTKIQAALKASAPKDKPDWSEVEKHMDAFEKAFEADKFDAKTLTTANAANTHIARWGEGRLVRFVEAVVPVLTPNQQKQFAEHLKERLTDQHGQK